MQLLIALNLPLLKNFIDGADESVSAWVSPRIEAGIDDRRLGRVRLDPCGASGNGALVLAEDDKEIK